MLWCFRQMLLAGINGQGILTRRQTPTCIDSEGLCMLRSVVTTESSSQAVEHRSGGCNFDERVFVQLSSSK